LGAGAAATVAIKTERETKMAESCMANEERVKNRRGKDAGESKRSMRGVEKAEGRFKEAKWREGERTSRGDGSAAYTGHALYPQDHEQAHHSHHVSCITYPVNQSRQNSGAVAFQQLGRNSKK
jgi:hypothetical protein